MMVFTHLTFDPCMGVIPKSAFVDHSLLQSVKIPKTIKKIGKEAFCNCESLSEVDFLQDDCGSLRTIGKHAFQGCIALQGSIRIPDTVRVVGLGAFHWCPLLTHVQLPTDLKVIRQHTFSGCKALREVVIPNNGLCKIEDSAFRGCESLEEIKIPDSVKVIESRAFEECRSLTLVQLPKAQKTIARFTFAYCNRLSGIVLPISLEEIDYKAFGSCYNLLGVEFAKDHHSSHRHDVKIHPYAFAMCRALVNVCLPASTVVESAQPSSIFARCIVRVSASGCIIGGWSSSRSSSSSDERDGPFAHSQLRDKDGNQHVRDRYAGLPIHSFCYYASVTAVDELQQSLDETGDHDSLEWQDYLGMTPFHIILATSANPRVDLLECLWSSNYPVVDWLTHQDSRGNIVP